MSSNSSSAGVPPAFTQAQINSLIKFGLILEYLLPASYQTLPMTSVVAALVDPSIAQSFSLPIVNVTELVLPVLGPEIASQAPKTVLGLGAYLSVAPTNSKSNALKYSEWLFTSFMLFAMALRIYARTRLTKQFRSYDWVAVVAMVLSIGLTFCALNGVYNHHAGDHIYHISWADFRANIIWTVAGGFIYHSCVNLAKASFLLFYIHLNPDRTFRRICYTMLVIVGLYWFSGLFTISFGCRPFNFWDHPLTRKCVNRAVMYTTKGALESAMDLAIWLLPIPVVWKLKFPMRQKLIMLVIFGAGFAICVTSFSRLFQISLFINGVDVTYDQADAVIWSVAECNLGIIISCVPAIKAFVTRYAPSILGTRRSSDSDGTPQPIADDTAEKKRPRGPFTGLFAGGASLFASSAKSKGSRLDSSLGEDGSINNLERSLSSSTEEKVYISTACGKDNIV